jgi:hypothetical protein
MFAPKVENKKLYEWTPSQKRAYQRIRTGVKLHRKELMRFLTLGSAPRMKRDIDESLRVIKERIKRLTPLKLIQGGYASPKQLRCQYAGKKLNEPLRFDYLKIKTSEGPHGVFHILYFGDFIPQAWIKEAWFDITGSCQSAFITACKNKTYDDKRLSRYIVSQYCISQQDGIGHLKFVSYSWSFNWAYPGFVNDWEWMKRTHRNAPKSVLYNHWDEWLERFPQGPPPHIIPTLQTELEGIYL